MTEVLSTETQETEYIFQVGKNRRAIQREETKYWIQKKKYTKK